MISESAIGLGRTAFAPARALAFRYHTIDVQHAEVCAAARRGLRQRIGVVVVVVVVVVVSNRNQLVMFAQGFVYCLCFLL